MPPQYRMRRGPAALLHARANGWLPRGVLRLLPTVEPSFASFTQERFLHHGVEKGLNPGNRPSEIQVKQGSAIPGLSSLLVTFRGQFRSKSDHLHPINGAGDPSLNGAPNRAVLGPVDLSCPTYVVWGSNTAVGKTLVSAGLVTSILADTGPAWGRKEEGHRAGKQGGSNAAKHAGGQQVLYLKPVQTGFPEDSDSRYVGQQAAKILSSSLRPNSPHSPVTILYEPPPGEDSWRTVLLPGPSQPDVTSPSSDTWGDQRILAVNQSVPPGRKDKTYPRSGPGPSMDPLSVPPRRHVSGASDPIDSQDWLRGTAAADVDSDARWQELSRQRSSLLLRCKTIWAWGDAVSPHLVAAREGTPVEDSLLVETIQMALRGGQEEQGGLQSTDSEVMSKEAEADSAASALTWRLLETAGGVASPGPSGSLQADIYRSLRLPGVLVGDGRLGGISATIAAYESLLLRGQDTTAVILVDGGLENEKAIRAYLTNRVPVFLLPPLPPPTSTDPFPELTDWFVQSEPIFGQLRSFLEAAHEDRVNRLQEMTGRAQKLLWWPFTQHGLVEDKDVTVIDSRSGENFAVFKDAVPSSPPALHQQMDACASWWTQGPSPSVQSELATCMAYAAARYGHVMYPQNVHEPALRCGELLLAGVGKGWASRVFYSDNGSTAIEVAIKMAFRKYAVDHKLVETAPGGEHPELQVVALAGSYHGDTLGAMEAQAPSAYTGFLQQPWYRGLGLFLVPPTVDCRKGQWHVHVPSSYSEPSGSFQNLADKDEMCFESRDAVFERSRDESSLAEVYRAFIARQLAIREGTREGAVPAALVIEPVIHGAGGMEMVDPLFQRILVSECRARQIPVIFDEVFVGCWRLGVESATQLLGCFPDIACYAKLLTGGMVPLAATLATEPIFESFYGDSKLSALLHGHSYTAHPVGCSAGVAALEKYTDPLSNPNYIPSEHRLKELWDPRMVAQISSHPAVERVVALGSIFVAELKVDGASGYASMATKGVVEGLRSEGVFVRPLGNVVYLMCGPMTSAARCSELLEKLERQLG